jgi:hypothetical protein
MPKKQKNLMGRGERTTLTRANDKSYSLRTTVPKGITSNFDLKEGDYLYWSIRPKKGGKELMIIVGIEHTSEAKKEKEVKG